MLMSRNFISDIEVHFLNQSDGELWESDFGAGVRDNDDACGISVSDT